MPFVGTTTESTVGPAGTGTANSQDVLAAKRPATTSAERNRRVRRRTRARRQDPSAAPGTSPGGDGIVEACWEDGAMLRSKPGSATATGGADKTDIIFARAS